MKRPRWVGLLVISAAWALTSCVTEMRKADFENDVRKYSTETVNHVWYIGSAEGFDYFIHGRALSSRKINVLASVESGRFTSPHGITTVTIVYNDAGAAHSGNHWTWIVIEHWLTGKRVVGQGYSLRDIISQPPEIKWIDEHSFTIPFAKGRHDLEVAETLVTLKG